MVAVLVNESGQNASNQALPAYASSAEPGVEAMVLTEVATLSVDETGAVVE